MTDEHMMKQPDATPLWEASFDQITNELGRRFSDLVIAGRMRDIEDASENTLIRVCGSNLIAAGLCADAQHRILASASVVKEA